MEKASSRCKKLDFLWYALKLSAIAESTWVKIRELVTYTDLVPSRWRSSQHTLTSRFYNNQCKDDSALFSRFLHDIKYTMRQLPLSTVLSTACREVRIREERVQAI